MLKVHPRFRLLVWLSLPALGGCATLPDTSDRTESRYYSDTDNTFLGQRIDEVAFRLTLEEAAQGYEQLRWQGLVAGEPVTFSRDPNTSFWRRFGIGLMRMLPVESQI